MGIQFDFGKFKRIFTKGNPKASNDEKASDTTLAAVKKIGSSLDLANGQLDEILDKELESKKRYLKKKIQRKIHELDEDDIIPDDIEEPIADYAVKIAFKTLHGAFNQLLSHFVTRQKEIDDSRQQDFQALKKIISKLYVSLIISLGLFLAYVLPTIVRMWLESGFLPLP